jgi:hypothetical protein
MDQVLIKKLRKASKFALIAVGLLAACAPAAIQTQTIEVQPPGPTEAENSPIPDPTISSSPSPTATEERDFSDFVFVPLLPYDGIRPIYEPDFVEAPDSPLNDDELVMGVAIQGEAKAYPVSVLRFREMVDDELGGLPILVTW